MSDESLMESAETAEESTTEETSEASTEDSPYGWVLDKYRAEGRSDEDAGKEQGKAYAELSKKFGGFVGAPDEYEYSIPEGFEGEYDFDDPMLAEFNEIAKDGNMSQEMHQKIAHLWVNNQERLSASIDSEAELSQLGDNAGKRLAGIDEWVKANMSSDQHEDMMQTTATAANVRFIEGLIAKTRTPQIPANDADISAKSGPSHSEIKARMDDPRYASDPSFRKETSKMYEQLFGNEPRHQIM